MSARDNGGPAFPVGFQHGESIAMKGGMTLRDYFAAKAMQAMLSGHFSHYGHEEYWDRDAVACEAYFVADAMLKERAK